MRKPALKPHYLSVSFYCRRLPHWHPEGAWIFLTWRLLGSLPRNKVLPPHPPNATDGQRFVALDRYLGRASTGPVWLKDPRVAACVVVSLLNSEEWGMYGLQSWVLMSNHVHVLLNPRQPVCKITRTVKNMCAREANRILGRTGEGFWQDESYDHWVRNPKEFGRIVTYIEENPVAAGLVTRADEWPWSSANPRFLDRAGR